MVDMEAVQEFVDTIKEPQEDTNTVYSATVARTDKDGTVWVYLAGSQKETPTASVSSEVKRGDSVNVEWRNNKLYIGGNYSNPSAGVVRVANVERQALTAQIAADSAVADAGRAKEAADSAQESATTAKADAQSAKTDAENAGRAASMAQAAADAAQETANSKKRVFTSQPVPPYSVGDLWVDTSGGVQNGDSLGYGSDVYSALVGTGQVGYMVVGGISAESESVVYVCTFARLDNESFNENDWQLAATDDGAVDELREWFWHDALGAHILGDESGFRNDIDSTGMHIVDTSTETSVAEFGSNGARLGKTGGAHSTLDSDGFSVTANDGTSRLFAVKKQEVVISGVTEKRPYFVLGDEIQGTTYGADSISVGGHSRAMAIDSCAIGDSNSANGIASVALGDSNDANGHASTVIGIANYADSDYQFVCGKRNIRDANDEYAFIIGNGEVGSRSNALTVDWDGKLTVEGHSSPIGTVLSSVWTASNSSASGTNCTAEITLTPGTWMLGMITPTCSTSIAYYFSNLSSTLTYPYFNMGTGGSGWVPVVITSSTSTRIKTGSSTSVTYSNTDRGQIFAVRIA